MPFSTLWLKEILWTHFRFQPLMAVTWQWSLRTEMIYLTYCLEFLGCNARKGYPNRVWQSPWVKTEFGKVKVARIHGAVYQRGKHYKEGVFHRSAEGSPGVFSRVLINTCARGQGKTTRRDQAEQHPELTQGQSLHSLVPTSRVERSQNTQDIK